MNLKESFRYQNFIKSMFDETTSSIATIAHAYNVTRLHKKSEANPEATDTTELPEEADFHSNDDVILLMMALIQEKVDLCAAIAEAKAAVLKSDGLSIDQATECNKMRRDAARALRNMMRFKKRKSVERGVSYKINAEGNQSQYYYDIEVDKEEAYDREKAKELSKSLSEDADFVSNEIDSCMVNCQVNFKPSFDVNDSFDDVMEKFLSVRK